VSFGDGGLKLIGASGLESGEVSLAIARAAVAGGASGVNMQILPRRIAIEAALDLSGMDEAAAASERESLIETLRADGQAGTLEVSRAGRSRKIGAFAAKGPAFLEKKWHEPWQRLRSEFLCPSPWFEDLAESRLDIKFYSQELELGEDGIEFGEEGMELSSILFTGTRKSTISNEGDAEAPVRIRFSGPLVNPVVRNLTTGEMVRIDRTIGKEEYLEINTTPGKRGIVLHQGGVDSNGMHCLDLASSFWQLLPGENVIEIGDESPGEGSEASIDYSGRYLEA
jgi:hypothetical protein